MLLIAFLFCYSTNPFNNHHIISKTTLKRTFKVELNLPCSARSHVSRSWNISVIVSTCFLKTIHRSNYSQIFFKIVVLKSLANFIEKRLCWDSLFKKVTRLTAFNKKRLQHKCFPVKFAKYLRTFFKEDLLWYTNVQSWK